MSLSWFVYINLVAIVLAFYAIYQVNGQAKTPEKYKLIHSKPSYHSNPSGSFQESFQSGHSFQHDDSSLQPHFAPQPPSTPQHHEISHHQYGPPEHHEVSQHTPQNININFAAPPLSPLPPIPEPQFSEEYYDEGSQGTIHLMEKTPPLEQSSMSHSQSPSPPPSPHHYRDLGLSTTPVVIDRRTQRQWIGPSTSTPKSFHLHSSYAHPPDVSAISYAGPAPERPQSPFRRSVDRSSHRGSSPRKGSRRALF